MSSCGDTLLGAGEWLFGASFDASLPSDCTCVLSLEVLVSITPTDAAAVCTCSTCIGLSPTGAAGE